MAAVARMATAIAPDILARRLGPRPFEKRNAMPHLFNQFDHASLQSISSVEHFHTHAECSGTDRFTRGGIDDRDADLALIALG